MSGFEQGAVYRYDYLWAREGRQGEESGRKARPVCLVLKLSPDPERLYLFPIMTRPPTAQALVIEVPESECRAGGLTQRCWLVLEEYNVARADRTYDFASLTPMGRFSRFFLRQIAVALKRAGAKRRPTGVERN